ncbi:MAG: hypothetical protein ACFCVC_08080 [Acidimicrobiia bacterium]
MHLVSYLSPGLPEGLFHHLGAVLSRALRVAVEVSFVTEASGPSPDLADPLRGADVAFVCGPSYVELRRVDAHRSIELVRSGRAEAAAIDANTLRRVDRSGLKVVHTFGPHPVQPIVAHPGFPMIEAVAETLGSARAPEWGVLGFAAVTEQDYPESLD